MTKRKKLNLENLSDLGADNLAAVLLEESSRNNLLKRKLNLMLSASAGSNLLAKDIRQRFNALTRSNAFLDRHEMRDLKRDLELLRTTIIDEIADSEPELALELLLRFLDLSEATLERCDDSRGIVSDTFRQAVEDLGDIAENASVSGEELSITVYERLMNNVYGIYDELIPSVYSSLGNVGLKKLEERLTARQDEPKHVNPEDDNFREIRVTICLQQIADVQGNVDAFIETHDERSLRNPVFAARIAIRLTAAGRAQEALVYLENARPNNDFGLVEWNNASISALLASGNLEEAQQRRWKMFQKTLDDHYLRDYLNVLPDIEDVEAEEQALSFAETYEDVHRALIFLTNWPTPDRASGLVLSRISEIDGNAYHILPSIAENLGEDYPLAAVLLRRKLIEYTLDGGKSTRYRHAIEHIWELESLDPVINDYGVYESHESFIKRLKEKHHRKKSFWAQLI